MADEAEPARAGTTLLVLAPPSDWSCLLQYDRAGAVPKVVSESDSDSHPTLKMMATVSIALDEVGYEDEVSTYLSSSTPSTPGMHMKTPSHT